MNSNLLTKHLLERQGMCAVMLEWRDRFGKSHDVCGCDVLGISDKGLVWVQSSALDKQDKMQGKLLATTDWLALLVSGATCLTHGWRIVDGLWTCRPREAFINLTERGITWNDLPEERVYTDGRGK